MTTVGSDAWYSEQVQYYYEYLGKVAGVSTESMKIICGGMNYMIRDWIVPGLSDSIQAIYISFSFNNTLEHYSGIFHHRAKIVYIISTVYTFIFTLLYVFALKSSYVRNAAPYVTIFSLISSFICLQSVGTLLFAEHVSCKATFVFQNYGIWTWALTFFFRFAVIATRSKVSMHKLGGADADNVGKGWLWLSDHGFTNEVFVLKLALGLSLIGLIPGIAMVYYNAERIFAFGVCNVPPSHYSFAIMSLILISLVLIVSFVFLKGIRNDIFFIRQQMIIYTVLFPGITLYVSAILIDRDVFYHSLTGYFSGLYFVFFFAILHVTICAVYPVILIAHSWYKTRSSKPERTSQFSVFTSIVMNEKSWRNFCVFSIRSFTDENTYFITSYENLLNAMRRKNRVFCSVQGEDSYIFKDMQMTRFGKMKFPTTFNARFHCLLTYDMPAEKIMIYDVEPNDEEMDILNQMYKDFFDDNAQFALNIPFELYFRVKQRFERRELTCLMLEEVKNVVVTMLYENTFAQFVSRNANSESGDNSNATSLRNAREAAVADEELEKSLVGGKVNKQSNRTVTKEVDDVYNA